MSFSLSQGWYCQFLETDLENAPAQEADLCLSQSSSGASGNLGGAVADLENRRMFEKAIITGRGGVYLHLTQAQV